MERRFFSLDLAECRVVQNDGKPDRIVGYASVFYDGTKRTEFELWPGVLERIMPGTFDKDVDGKRDVVGLFNHDPSAILGRRTAGTLSLSVDKRGLLYDIEAPATSVGRDVVASIQRRDLSGSSFSFDITDEEWRKVDGVEIREITGVRLFDVGPVTFPAYSGSTTGLRFVGLGDGLREARDSHERWKSALQARNRGLLDLERAKLALDTDAVGV